ncbi:MAG: hypothetical protein ALECFALPRED_001951 [Alectoria fallacina]|uniref:Uncharacterized protein n=1 Tax=Alectoria fallacina TaxID=1903189 RepID=A0A8H3EL50_9LECA|nr:MAG: hypothetical protein ALECFALPRED_001951 [Alectoria fallacina]
MKLFVFLIYVSSHLASALLLPLNSSVLRLPSQDNSLATEEFNTSTHNLEDNPWPPLPFERSIKNGLSITITAYGDMLSKKYTPNVLQALFPIQLIIQNAGEPSDVLEETTTIGEMKGKVYTEVGFYSLHPPGGIKRSQAADVLHKVWQLVIEYFPAKEITSSTITAEGEELALFRLSFRRT